MDSKLLNLKSGHLKLFMIQYSLCMIEHARVQLESKLYSKCSCPIIYSSGRLFRLLSIFLGSLKAPETFNYALINVGLIKVCLINSL
jgi:hypothetical protein